MPPLTPFTALILAAGKGSRLGGDTPKPLVLINGKPLIEPIIHNCLALMPEVLVAVSAYTLGVRELYRDSRLTCHTVIPRGTGANVLDLLAHVRTPHILIAQADDSYFYTQHTLEDLAAKHLESRADFTIASTRTNLPLRYSQVNSDADGRFLYIDTSDRAKAAPSKDIVCGLYAARTEWLRAMLPRVAPSADGEIGLPWVTLPGLQAGSDMRVFPIPRGQWEGINTQEELESARRHALTA